MQRIQNVRPAIEWYELSSRHLFTHACANKLVSVLCFSSLRMSFDAILRTSSLQEIARPLQGECREFRVIRCMMQSLLVLSPLYELAHCQHCHMHTPVTDMGTVGHCWNAVPIWLSLYLCILRQIIIRRRNHLRHALLY